MSKVLITGINGFIGRRLATTLAERGHEVYGFDLVPPPLGWRERWRVRVADLCDPQTVEPGTDIVFHLGALNEPKVCQQNPYGATRVNVLGTVNMAVQAAQLGARFVYANTWAHFDSRSMGWYAATKFCGEHLLKALVCQHAKANAPIKPFQLVRLRYTNVYGPGQRETSVVPRFVAEAVRGQRSTLLRGDAENLFDFVHVDDVNAFHVELVDRWPGANHYYELGTGVLTSVAALHRLVVLETGAPEALELDPPPGWQPTKSAEVRLPPAPSVWTPRVTLRAGLKELIAIEREKVGATPCQAAS